MISVVSSSLKGKHVGTCGSEALIRNTKFEMVDVMVCLDWALDELLDGSDQNPMVKVD